MVDFVEKPGLVGTDVFLTGVHKDKEVGKPLPILTKGKSDIWVCGFG